MIVYTSVLQPGLRGTLGYREWLLGVPTKRTEFAWDEISNYNSMRL